MLSTVLNKIQLAMNQFDPLYIIPQHSHSYTDYFSCEGFQMDAFVWSTSSKSRKCLESLMRASHSDDSNLLNTAPGTLLGHDQTRSEKKVGKNGRLLTFLPRLNTLRTTLFELGEQTRCRHSEPKATNRRKDNGRD